IPLNDLAMSDSTRLSVVEIFKRPQGMLIVTGPTGSGKTTTLYACLSQLRSETKNIVTIEDPVEYKLEGITQIQINEMIGCTFATVLRAVLRQDPDIIKIGEIRDLETAEIAIRASLTGHLVLTTLHTNNTVATITRLMDIGIPTYLINSAISGVLAQRLVRRLCDNCKVESKVPDDLSSIIDHHGLPKLTSHYSSTGCPKCFNTGYVGRVAVYEYLPMSQSFKRLISKNVSEEDLLIAAKSDGVNFLFDDAWNKVKAGITTAEEVLTKVPLDYYDLRV
ncbi:MAG: type II/IV secretion system protein, partial [Nitrospirae bacterium]|nr:type II/IV secretion system protein [Nitrospirota bacterium]